MRNFARLNIRNIYNLLQIMKKLIIGLDTYQAELFTVFMTPVVQGTQTAITTGTLFFQPIMFTLLRVQTKITISSHMRKVSLNLQK